MTNIRHFTATGFIVHDNHVLLHWHNKVKEWLPPGGHIEENEDPMQAVIREIYEETNLNVTVVPTHPAIQFNYPEQVHAPVTIMIEDIDDPIDGFHQHIDMIYYCKLTDPQQKMENWVWVSQDQLMKKRKLGSGNQYKSPPKDVREIGIHAIQTVDYIS